MPHGEERASERARGGGSYFAAHRTTQHRTAADADTQTYPPLDTDTPPRQRWRLCGGRGGLVMIMPTTRARARRRRRSSKRRASRWARARCRSVLGGGPSCTHRTAPRRTAPHRAAPHGTTPHPNPHRAAPRRTAPHPYPHRTASHRTAPHRTAPHAPQRVGHRYRWVRAHRAAYRHRRDRTGAARGAARGSAGRPCEEPPPSFVRRRRAWNAGRSSAAVGRGRRVETRRFAFPRVSCRGHRRGNTPRRRRVAVAALPREGAAARGGAPTPYYPRVSPPSSRVRTPIVMAAAHGGCMAVAWTNLPPRSVSRSALPKPRPLASRCQAPKASDVAARLKAYGSSARRHASGRTARARARARKRASARASERAAIASPSERGDGGDEQWQKEVLTRAV